MAPPAPPPDGRVVVVERRVVGRVEDGEVMPVVVGLNDDWTKVEGGRRIKWG